MFVSGKLSCFNRILQSIFAFCWQFSENMKISDGWTGGADAIPITGILTKTNAARTLNRSKSEGGGIPGRDTILLGGLLRA
jgi:hypothetical protein